MKYLKYVFSSMLIAGALVLAGCGSSKGSTTRDDGGRSGNVIKEITIKRQINVEGVIRGHKTGAPLDNIKVTLIQNGKIKEAKTVDLNGHYAFLKVEVAQDNQTSGVGQNNDNDVQLEFSEIKTKKLNGDGELVDGSDLYPNGTETPSYPESRISFELIAPDLSGVDLTAADAASTIQANNLNGNFTGSLTLADAINEGRSYYFVDANTVRIRDVRLVQTGVLTGTVIDSDTGLPVQNAYVTISTDPYFRSPLDDAGDIVAVWQQTRITATLSSALGAFTFASIPALDYDTSIAAAQLHVEAQGYTENNAAGWPDHANIRDDLVGSVGVLLINPIKVTMKTVTMTFVDENLAVLPGVTVTFKYDATESSNTAYATALANAIATDTRWVFTSDANGVVTGSIPALEYNNDNTSKDFTATLSGYKLDTTFTAIVIDDDDIKLDLFTFGGVDSALDLGIIKMIPDDKKFAAEFRVQLIYKEAPLVGATVTGVVKYVDADVSVQTITLLISGDGPSDSNGFVTFNATKIPASAAGLSVDFTFDVSLTGATSIVSALTGTYVVDDGDDLDLQELLYNDASVTTVATNDIHQITIKDKLLKLAGLEGYVVTGHAAAPTSNGTVSFSELAGANLKLVVTKAGNAVNYFTTSDANGYYAFLASAGVSIPVSNGDNNLDLDLVVLGDFVFSDGGDNTIDLEDDVGANNGVDQIDTNGGFPGGTAWLWQLDESGDELALKYDGKTLQVHTAAIEPSAAVIEGFHVVSLVKTVAGVSTLSVIENDGTQLVYTYTQAQDDATGISIIMSDNLDTTLPFQYNGLTGVNLAADNKTMHRLQVDIFDLAGNNLVPTGETLTFTGTAAGRTITIVPSGNANKFETDVTYKLLVRAVSDEGEVSDDFLFFRFYNAAGEIFSTEAPSVDVTTMTTGDYWFLRNEIAAEADNYKLALNDANGVFAVNEVHFLVYKEGTGFDFATGGIQNRAWNINDLKLTFPVPTDLRTGVTAVTTVAQVATDLADFEVWAQAYTVSGVILQHWTNVSTAANATVGNNFDPSFAGKMKIGLTIFGNSAPNIFEKALAEGNRVDLTVVHKNSQINPVAAKCLTLSLTNHAGIQGKTAQNGAGVSVDATNAGADGVDDYEVTLSEATSAVAATAPTMTLTSGGTATAVHGIALTNVKYAAANSIIASAALSYTNGTDITISSTASLNASAVNYVVDAGGVSHVILSSNTALATLVILGNENRVGRELRFDADGATVTVAPVDGAITKHRTVIQASIPIISGAAKDYTYASNNATALDSATGDGSTTTAIDIDQTADTINTNAVANAGGRTYVIKYANLSAGRLKSLLASLEVDDIISTTSNFYLVVTARNVGASTIDVSEFGNFAADVRVPLAYDGTASTGGTLLIAPQIEIPTGVTSSATTSGIAEAISTNSNATTGIRNASNNNFNIIDSTTVVVTADVQLYPGDAVVILTNSGTATNGNEPMYSALVTGAFNSPATGTTLVALNTVTQIRGTTESFAAQGQTARNDGFVFRGDQVTVGLGAGIVSLLSGAAVNTNGDAVSLTAFTDGTDVQNDNGEGFEGVQ